MVSWSERMISHTGTDTRSRLLREAAVRNLRNGGNPDAATPLSDEGFRVVKLCQVERSYRILIVYGIDGTTEGSTG